MGPMITEEYKINIEYQKKSDEEYLAFDPFCHDIVDFKEFGKKKIVKTRKIHECSSPVGKKHMIQIGERVRYECMLDSGDTWLYHWTCFDCINECIFAEDFSIEDCSGFEYIPPTDGKLSKMRPDLDHTDFARAQIADSIETHDEYDSVVLSLAVYPDQGSNFTYPALGLAGEAGEVADKIKKVLRDKNGILHESDRVAILKEIGDVMWYCAALSAELGSSSKECAQMNVKKLLDRNAKGTLQGEGDDR